MPYMTAKQSPRYHQVTMEDILFGDADPFAKPTKPWRERIDQGATRTWYVEVVPDAWYQKFNVAAAIDRLEKFAVQFAPLYEADRWSLYDHWTVPKRNGGRRPIDAPKPELEVALRTLKAILETDFGALHHTSAFAYVKGRCTLDAARKHQQNESRWFLHTDFSNFFGSTTLLFVVEMLSRIWPFSEVCRYPRGKEALEKTLDLCFLRGGLPQGTPISPLITNLMMVPIDFKLAGSLRDFERNRYIYTRYADDIYISSRYDFDPRRLTRHINSVLEEFHAPFRLNPEKTRYNSRAGRNYILGVKLNKDNKISIGYERKKAFRSWLNNYLSDRKESIPTPAEELYKLGGYISYYHSIEPEWVDAILDCYGKRFGVDVNACIKEDLAA